MKFDSPRLGSNIICMYIPKYTVAIYREEKNPAEKVGTYTCSLRFLKGLITVLLCADGKKEKKLTAASIWNWSVMGCITFPCVAPPAQSLLPPCSAHFM